MEQRTQFAFYESFFQALSRIKKKTDRASAYDIICRYALYNEMPDLEKLSDSVAIAFELVKPNLDASRRKALSGKMGGLNNKQTRSKLKANAKQGESASKGEKEIEIELKTEVEDECQGVCTSVKKENGCADIPTREQVQQFARERNSTADPNEFFDYYQLGQWHDAQGKPVISWQQKFLAWELRSGARKTKTDPYAQQESEAERYREDLKRMERYLEEQRAQP